ncbi:MAG: hypothetical protein KJ621_04880 [Proteobacteria bacterium]|nr:hypothetical protein [Pseudomonadota bacterium]MBU1740596.1 hypothetical protein [Pseudomonadota bacterium]
MTAVDVQSLAKRVKRNCDVSDARFGRQFSMCGLLLRLRNLYKSENGVPPWEEPDSGPMLEWVAGRERLWDRLESEEIAALEVGGQRVDPFDVEEINRRLAPAGFAYAAGYGPFLKPTFVLGELLSRRRDHGLDCLVIGRELARDLSFSPAMRQGEVVIGLTGAMRLFFWDRVGEPAGSTSRYMAAALNYCGLDLARIRRRPAEHAGAVDEVCGAEVETYLAHERGEARDDTLDPAAWREAVADHAATEIELLARTLKDLLADTHDQGLLIHVRDADRPASLLFYLAFVPMLHRLLMPEVVAAAERFVTRPDWEELTRAKDEARQRIVGLSRRLFDLIEAGRHRPPDWTRREVHDRIVVPLGARGLSPDGAD